MQEPRTTISSTAATTRTAPSPAAMWSRCRASDRLRLPALALLACCAGCTASRVWSLSSSPDGQRLAVVGAEVNELSNPPAATKPLRWTCLRGADDRLTCRLDPTPLPKRDRRAPSPGPQ